LRVEGLGFRVIRVITVLFGGGFMVGSEHRLAQQQALMTSHCSMESHWCRNTVVAPRVQGLGFRV
jgi:hypothetical protein